MDEERIKQRKLGAPEFYSWMLNSAAEMGPLNERGVFRYDRIDPENPFDPFMFLQGFPAIPIPTGTNNPEKLAKELKGLQVSWGAIDKTGITNIASPSTNEGIARTKQVNYPGQIWIVYEHISSDGRPVTGLMSASAKILENLSLATKDKKILKAVVLPEPFGDYQNLTRSLLTAVNSVADSENISLSPRDTKVLLRALRATYFTQEDVENTGEMERFRGMFERAVAAENVVTSKKKPNVYDPENLKNLLQNEQIGVYLNKRLTNRARVSQDHKEYPIAKEYLKTNPLAQTLLFATGEIGLRLLDGGIGSIPVVSALYDGWQFIFNKEIPFAQAILDGLWDKGVKIPSALFKGMKNGRGIQFVDVGFELLLNTNLIGSLMSQVPFIGAASEVFSQFIQIAKKLPHAINMGNETIILNGILNRVNNEEWLLNPNRVHIGKEFHRKITKPIKQKVQEKVKPLK